MKQIIFLFLLASSLFALPSFSTAQKEKYLYVLGKKIASLSCKELQNEKFETLEALYDAVKSRCGLREERYNLALSYYLWDRHKKKSASMVLHVTKKERCPVCGMFVYKYPKWIAAAVTKKHKKLYFDGVKDMMKYYFLHKNEIEHLYVQDYYTKKVIDAADAWFVTGSDVYGPMGEEAIPFASKTSAEAFRKDHGGNALLRFNQLSGEVIGKLDE